MSKVLIIDDSEFFRGIYRDALVSKGFEVELASDGKAGIEQMLAAPPQLVFLDLIMPQMSGEEVLKQIQLHESLRGIPIIMLTSISSQVAGSSLLGTGPLAGYLKKEDATPEDVVSKAQEVLGTYEKAYDPTTDIA
jgi:CheY-like chemotaxis protein